MDNDTQVRIDKPTHRIIQKFARGKKTNELPKWSVKAAIRYLVRTHPEIAPKTDDKEV